LEGELAAGNKPTAGCSAKTVLQSLNLHF